MHTASSLPIELPLYREELVKDRTELWGLDFSAEARAQRRPRALAAMRTHYTLLEDLLSDGSQWILGTDSITLCDIHGELS